MFIIIICVIFLKIVYSVMLVVYRTRKRPAETSTASVFYSGTTDSCTTSIADFSRRPPRSYRRCRPRRDRITPTVIITSRPRITIIGTASTRRPPTIVRHCCFPSHRPSILNGNYATMLHLIILSTSKATEFKISPKKHF